MTTQADLLREDITSELARSRKSRVQLDLKDNAGQELMEEYVLPHMPRSLGEHFRPTYISFIIDNTLRVDFAPRENDYPAELVLGTLRKAESGLVKGGWTVADGLAPEAYGSTLVIRLNAFREVTEPERTWYGRQLDILMGREHREPESHTLFLNMAFERLKSTEHCQLVDKQMKVEAVPEHFETKKVLVCDEEGWSRDGQ